MTTTKKIIRVNGEEIHEPLPIEAIKGHLLHKERTEEELRTAQAKLYEAVANAAPGTDEEYLMDVTKYADELITRHYPEALRYQELEAIRVANIINSEFPDWVMLEEPDLTGLWLPNG